MQLAQIPGVLGLKEILPSNLADVANLVAPLTLVPRPSTGPTRWFGVGASSGGNQGREYLPIAYHGDRFELRDSGGFWISATPDRRGSMLPLARTPFLVHWARLAPRDLSGSLLVMNAHFGRTPWHHAPIAQVVTAQLDALEAASPVRSGTNGTTPRVFPVRSFNAIPTRGRLQSLSLPSGDGLVNDGRRAAERSVPPVTYLWGRGATRFGLTLDYVVARTPSRPARAGLSDADNGGLYLYDHHLLVLNFVPDRSPGCASDRRMRGTPR